jgi:1,2-diacylglycerol 3-beta-galactosyltransferase
MPKKTDRKPNILFLFADTGGGHRSAAEAIIEAINLEFPDQFTTEMVDFFKDYAPPPLNLAGPTYPGHVQNDLYVGMDV